MKRTLLITLALSLILICVLAVPALAKAGKADLISQDPNELGGGFIIINVSSYASTLSGSIIKAEMTASLKGALPNTIYDVGIPAIFGGGMTVLGSILTNKQGNGNMHTNITTPLGIQLPPTFPLTIEVVNDSTGFIAYEADVPITIK
jgi:hypothetical protein